jgi:hypothetical protein
MMASGNPVRLFRSWWVRICAVGRELFNLRKDSTESMDLAGKHPDIVACLERLLDQEHARSELFPLHGTRQPLTRPSA